MRRALALAFGLASLVALAQYPQHRLFDQPNLWRAVTSALSTPYVGQWLEFLPTADGGTLGASAVCACTALSAITSDGDAGVALTLSRASNAVCTKGNVSSGIVPGDLVVCGNGLPRVMPGGDGTGPRGILTELQGISLAKGSEAFDVGGAPWLITADGGAADPAIASSNTVLAPDNATTADAVTFGAVTTATQVSALSQLVLSAAVYSGGVYALGLAGDAGSFDVAIDKGGGGVSCQPCNYNASTWTRCADENITSLATGRFLIGNLGICDGGTRAAQTVALWGAQAEAGPRLTSYIPTTPGATYTRLAETGSFTVASTSNAAMSMAVTASIPWTSAGAPSSPIFMSAGTGATLMQLYASGTTTPRCIGWNTRYDQVSGWPSVPDTAKRMWCAFDFNETGANSVRGKVGTTDLIDVVNTGGSVGNFTAVGFGATNSVLYNLCWSNTDGGCR